jgi:hypothetical protein
VLGWDCPVHQTLSAVPQRDEFFVGQWRRQIGVHFPDMRLRRCRSSQSSCHNQTDPLPGFPSGRLNSSNGQRGCFPTKTLAWPRRLYRMRDRCAVLRTLLQCVCTQRRNCIGQLSPFSEYAPTALRNKWKPAATIKLIHYRRLGAKPHESSASDGYLGIQCLQRFQSLDATRNSDCRYPAQRTARPLRREPAGFAMPFRSHPTLKFSAEVFPLLGTSS